MRVAHLNTQSYGGAAMVAHRINSALRDVGVDSVLVTKYGLPSKIAGHVFERDASLRYFLRKKLSKEPWFSIVKKIQGVAAHPNLKNRRSGFEVFSPTYRAKNFPLEEFLSTMDILHLHWINGFVDYSYFFSVFGNKKMVWTLHDMNPFTGGCHHSDGCVLFKNGCPECYQLEDTIDQAYSRRVFEEKLNGLKHLSNDQLVVVSPSLWLNELAKRSEILGRFTHIHIPNPTFDVDPEIFSKARTTVREEVSLPIDKKIVLFAADNLKNSRKGIDVLFEAARQLNNKSEILFLGVGHSSTVPDGLDVKYTGSISDVKKLSSYYYASDVFVTPSFAENSPLVVIEALTMGTPVIASNVGGIPDLLTSKSGQLFQPGNSGELASTLSKILFGEPLDLHGIRNAAAKIHHPAVVAEQYRRVYERIFSNQYS